MPDPQVAPSLAPITPPPAPPPGDPKTVAEYIDSMAQQHGVPKSLAWRILNKESGGKHAVAGQTVTGEKTPYGQAVGMFQVLPTTAAKWKLDVNDPLQNIEAGIRVLREGLDAHDNDIENAAMYYHGGSDQKLWGAKTRAYGREIRAALEAEFDAATKGPAPAGPRPVSGMPSRRALLGAAPPTPTWAERHPILDSIVQGMDPHEVEGRHNIAGAVGGAVGATLAVPAGFAGLAVGGPVGAAAAAAVARKAGSAIGAGTFGAAEHALIEETPIGGWIGEHLPLGEVDQKYVFDPNQSAFERSARAGGEQAIYDVVGNALMLPLKMAGKRLAQSSVGKWAAEAFDDARAFDMNLLYERLNQLRTGGRQATAASNDAAQAVNEAAIRAREDAARRAAEEQVRIRQEGGQQFRQAQTEMTTTKRAGAERLEQGRALGDSAIDAARQRAQTGVADAATAAERAVEDFRTSRVQPLLDEAPYEGPIGTTIASLFEGPAKKAQAAMGRAVEQAAEKGPDLDYKAVEEEAARLLREEILPALQEFPTQPGGIPAPPAAPPPPPPIPGAAPRAGSQQGRAVAAGQQNLFAPPPPPAGAAAPVVSDALQALIGDIGQPAYEALLADPTSRVLMRILNRPSGKGKFLAGHQWKSQLQEAVRGILDKTQRTKAQGRTMKLASLLRESLGVHEPYNVATKAYADAAPTFTKGLATTIRQNARHAPEKIVQALSMEDPSSARQLVELLTTHTEAGAREGFVHTARETAEKAARAAGKTASVIKRAGDTAAKKATKEGADAAAAAAAKEGQAALGEVQKAWVYRHLTEGGIEGLPDRLTKLKAHPEFQEAFLTEGPGKQAITELEQLAATWAELQAQGKAGVQAAEKAGAKGVRTTKGESKTLTAQLRKENAIDVEAAGRKVRDVMDTKQAALDAARERAAKEATDLKVQGRDARHAARKATRTGTRETAEKIQAARSDIRQRGSGTKAEVDFSRSSLGGRMRAPEQLAADAVALINRGGYHGAIGLVRLLKGSRSAELLHYSAFAGAKKVNRALRILLDPKTPVALGTATKLGAPTAARDLYTTATGQLPPRQEKR